MNLMKSKKSLSLVAILVLSFSFILGSCGTKAETEGGKDVVVATVNGEDILHSEFYDMYNYTLEYNNLDPETEDEEQLEEIEKIKDDLLENMILRKVMMQKIKEADYEITDEIKQEAENEYKYTIQMYGMQMQMQDQMQGVEGIEGKNYEEEAEKFILEQIEAMNQTKDDYLADIEEQILANNFLIDLTDHLETSEEEIKSFYDRELDMHKQGEVTEIDIIKNPDQTRVKHILLGLSDEDKKEYENLLYVEGKAEEAESLLEEKLAEIKPKAEQVLEKAKNGDGFEALIDEYGEDPGMEMEENKDGYLVSAKSNFVPEFQETSLKLKVDEISDLVPTQHGYHIIKAYEKMEEALFTFEEKRDEIKNILDVELKSNFVDKEIEKWIEESEIERYKDRI